MASHTVFLEPARSSSFRFPDFSGVYAVVEQLQHTWNCSRAETFAREFTSDADFVDINGVHAAGRTSIAAAVEGALCGTHRGSKMELEVVKLRLLGDDVAVAHLRQYLFVPEGRLMGGHDSTCVAVLVHRAGEWKITTLQYTPVPDPIELPLASASLQ